MRSTDKLIAVAVAAKSFAASAKNLEGVELIHVEAINSGENMTTYNEALAAAYTTYQVKRKNLDEALAELEKE